MRINLQVATPDDVPDLVSLRTATGGGVTAKGVLYAMKISKVYIARHNDRLIATLTLSTRKPWAIDTKYFGPSKRPLYLTAMAVDPNEQRRGIGTLCMDEARRIAKEWPADALRLDAYDTETGAGDFYRKCGFREAGRATYRKCPLIYFEMLL